MKKIIILILCVHSLYGQFPFELEPKIQSLIIPGWGEYSIGKTKRAKNFFIRETILFLTFINNYKMYKWYESDYIAFAELHANVSMDGKPYLFNVNIGHYNSRDDYNSIMELQRLPSEKYLGNKYFWNWDNENNRIKYDQIRISSVTAKKYTKFGIGGMILHRLVSFFDIIYLERNNKSIELETKISNEFNNLQFHLYFKI